MLGVTTIEIAESLLSKASTENSRLLLLAACHCMSPYYVRFCRTSADHDPRFLSLVLDDLWAAADSRNEVQFRWKSTDVFRVAPDTEDYDSAFTGEAMRACACVGIYLEFVIENEANKTADILTNFFDVISSDYQIDLVADLDRKWLISLQHLAIASFTSCAFVLAVKSSAPLHERVAALKAVFQGEEWQQMLHALGN
jgi:hypothetical protein